MTPVVEVRILPAQPPAGCKMVDKVLFVVTLLSAVGVGISAGLYFIFSNTVMDALSRIKPPEGIAAMQSINRVILNPLFFLVFMGTAITSLIIAVSLFWRWGQPGSVYLLFGSLFYLIGTILVTVVFNVPMNNDLDRAQPESSEAKTLWEKYVRDWTAWNHVRTASCILGLLSFILALREIGF